MAGKRLTPEQIVAKLKEIEVLQASGKDIALACKAAGVSDKSYYRWRKEYGGLKSDQARRFKELENENARLKRLVAELSLEKAVLKEVASGNF